jgi:hypothetical protein
MKTLNEIAAEYGVSLQTVYNWRSAVEESSGQKIEGMPHPNDGRKVVYGADAVALITQGRNPLQVAEPLDVTVETGNHCRALAMPDMNGTEFSLEQFRADDIEAWVFDDPAAIADQFLAVADRLVSGMEVDIKQREQRLQATKVAQNKVAEKAQELKLEQRLYRDRTRALDTAQTEQTQSLKDAMESLQSLGKPAVSGDGNAA